MLNFLLNFLVCFCILILVNFLKHMIIKEPVMLKISKTLVTCIMFFGIVAVLSVPGAHVSAGNWNTGTKTERSKVAPGVYLERMINKKTGKVESEVTLIQTPDGYFQAEKKADGSWGLTAEGKADQEAAQEAAAASGGGSGGSGGGGC